MRLRLVVPTTRPAGSRTITTPVTTPVTPDVERLLETASEAEMTRLKLQERLGLANKKHFRLAYLQAALQAGLLEMTIPGKPNSRLQKYRLTTRGRAWVAGRPGVRKNGVS